MVYIGIDLGTTYSCVAIIENGVCKIIFDDEGKHFLPSIVSFGDEEILNKVGYVLNRGKPNERFVTPEEVSAEILKKIKAIAESYIGSQVTGAVVTIPATFQDNQIAATKRAVEMAGLELKLLIDEPTAAAVAYNAERELDDSMIMIFDFGGGPDPPEWRGGASVAYFKDKLYYLGGVDPKSWIWKDTNRVDLLMVLYWVVERYIDYQTMNENGLKLERFQKYDIISEFHR
ncbi:hypothetical protein WR25_26601 [Diploscapter pachys]|uniref:Uncharacterized protein n=1 Tax=Diploscapter pachys TaxID=2018661 RepID=A0A2A2LNA7_9BILA|nr:hypothetical protein WR25_26601 [Diploscapter pachys]